MKFLIIHQDWANWFENENKYPNFLREIKLDGFDMDTDELYCLVPSVSKVRKKILLQKNMICEVIPSTPIFQFFQIPCLAYRCLRITMSFKADFLYSGFVFLAPAFLLTKFFRKTKIIVFARVKIGESILSKDPTNVLRMIAARIAQLLDRLAFRHADLILHNGKSIQQYVETSGTSARILFAPRMLQDTEVFNKLCNEDKSKLKEHLGLQNKKIILNISRLHPEKNVSMILRTLKELPERYTLIIIGDGIQRMELENLAKDLGIAKRVRFIGLVPHREVWRYYHVADVFTLCSKTDFEGTPNVLKEAMYAGVPAIATDIKGCKNAIKNQYNGMLVKIDDINEMKNTILLIEQDPKKRSMLVSNGRAWVQQDQQNVRSMNYRLKEARLI